MNTVKNYWKWFAVGVSGSLGILCVTWGATYNFHFNNTEQGDNSTATPTVTVGSDGKAKTSAGDSSGTATTNAALGDSAAASNVAKTESATSNSSKPVSRWGFNISVASLWLYGRDYGALIGAQYMFTRDLGFRAFIGNSSYPQYYGGAEFLLTPIHLTFGKFEDLLDAGILLGLSRMRRHGDAFINNLDPHLGASATLNLAHGWGLQTSVRANRDFILADAGIAIQF